MGPMISNYVNFGERRVTVLDDDVARLPVEWPGWRPARAGTEDG